MDTNAWIGFLSGYLVLFGYTYNRESIRFVSKETNFIERTKYYWPLSALLTVGAFLYFFLLSLRNGISEDTTGWLYVFITGASIWPWTLPSKRGEFSAILLTAVGSVGLLVTCDASVRGAIIVLVVHHVGLDLLLYGIYIRRLIPVFPNKRVEMHDMSNTFTMNSIFFKDSEMNASWADRIVFELYVLYFGPLAGAWVWTDASGFIIVTITGLHFVIGFLSTLSINPCVAAVERYAKPLNIFADILIATGLGFGIVTILEDDVYRWAGLGCATVGNVLCFYQRSRA